MTSANGLEQRPGRRVRRGPRQLPKVAQDPACGPTLADLQMLQLLRAESVGRHQLKGKAPAGIRDGPHQRKAVLHLQGRRDGFRRTRSAHEHRQILRRLPVLAQPPLRHGPTQKGGGRLNLDLAGAPARLVRQDPRQCLQQLLCVLRRRYRSHGSEHVFHVVPLDPMPGRRLDLATDQLVLPESSDQLFPVPRSKHRRHSPVPGSTGVGCLRTAACTRLSL